VIRKLKSARCDYDYIELMACPSGCLNGGGQIKPEQMATEGKLEPIEVLASVEANHL
jgi:iron only hydrogenase large subunit-like protein